MSHEHHEGLGPLRCCSSVLHTPSTKENWGWGGTSEPDTGRDSEPEEGELVVRVWVGKRHRAKQNHDLKTNRVRKNLLGNNIWKMSLWFIQNCSLIPHGRSDSSEVFFLFPPRLKKEYWQKEKQFSQSLLWKALTLCSFFSRPSGGHYPDVDEGQLREQGSDV